MNSELSFLYIDDTESSRKVMRLMLTDMLGYEDLVLLEDSSDLINRLDQLEKQFRIVFLDINVEPLNGYDVCKLLRQHDNYSSARIIALTASTRPSDLEKMRDVGFDGAISKPLDLETFPNQLQSILIGDVLWDAI